MINYILNKRGENMSKKTRKIATWIMLIVMVVGTFAAFAAMFIGRN